MKPNPLYLKPEPVVRTKPFVSVLEASLEAEEHALVMAAARGWTERSEHWGARHKTAERQWPHPACSSFAAYNALEPFATLHGHGKTMLRIDPMDIHRIAMEIDGLERGDAESMTTLEAACEAAAQLLNQAAGENVTVWARVPVDSIGAWQSVVSPVAVSLTWWWDWLGYSAVWKTLLWPHENPKPVANHAVALVGHLPNKRAKWLGRMNRVRAFEVHDSQGEQVWIQDYALVRSMREPCGYGFITPGDVMALRKGRKAEGLRES